MALANRSPAEMLRAVSSMFTTFWLVDAIDRAKGRKIPTMRNLEGDEVVLAFLVQRKTCVAFAAEDSTTLAGVSQHFSHAARKIFRRAITALESTSASRSELPARREST